MQIIKDYINSKLLNGVRLPMVRDELTGKPSITLSFSIVTFVLAVVSVVLLHKYPVMILASLTAVGFWAIATILYIIRRINKATVDLDDRSVSVEGGA